MHKCAIILVIVVLCWGCEEDTSITNGSEADGGVVIGIDVSHHQKSIDWSKVKEWKGKPIQFVYIKATEGSTYQDKRYRENFTEALSNNLNVGSYHYFRTSSSVDGQFQNFTNHVDKDSQVLIPMVDVEEKKNWSDKVFHKNLKEFLALVEAHYGVKPLIYCVNSFYNEHLSRGYKGYQFMIGRYGPNEPNMRHGGPWTIWQFSETGEVKGIERKVDIDRLNPRYKLSDLQLPKE